VLDYPVTVRSLAVGIGGMALFIFINVRGVAFAAGVQAVLTFGLIGASAVFMIAGIGGGETANLKPVFGLTAPYWVGFLTVLVTIPNWLAGFNIIPQLMEEKDPGAPLKTVAAVMIFSVALGTAFYCLVIISASMAVPWPTLLEVEMPVAAAFEAAFDSAVLTKVVLVAGLFGLLSTWNAVILASSRLLFAMGRAHIIPTAFGRPHPVYRTPSKALVFICIVGIVATLAGRSVLGPLINTSGTCFAFAFLISALGVLKLRREQPDRARPYRVPGGVATIGVAALCCLIILLLSIYLPWRYSDGIPVEWIIIIAWLIVGGAFWRTGKKFRSRINEQQRRALIFGEDSSDNR
jgi:amino acid transporter